ncbi:MAG: ribonuclease P protein component [Candidatus Acetothermia bacterium]|jgi:ribonuclease P protein component|nr:ribonuclease P protein component [Candidatus Acetothermia bacterium]MDH7504770.1 ribonuclease P protein component [Candidatus Acetothermia bacterium]
MEDERFARESRLRSRRDFQRVYREGRSFEDRCFRVVYRRAGGPPRLGLVAARRLGGAVERNRAKRVIREAFRTNKGLFAGLELIVHLRPAAMALSKGELREEFLKVGARLARLD